MSGNWCEVPLPNRVDPDHLSFHVLTVIDHVRRISHYACGRSESHPGDKPIFLPVQTSGPFEIRAEGISLCPYCAMPGRAQAFL
jgi:hypothetical protein